ncbi:MAG: hypothetical protein AAFZ15_24095 [Bacteroidota bacterium]
MKHPYKFDDIDNYVHGRMSEAELKDFKATLAINENLQKETEAAQAQSKIMAYLRKEALLKEMNEEITGKKTASGNEDEGNGTTSSIKILWLIGAVLAILIAASLLWNINSENEEQSNQEETNINIEVPEDSLKNKPIIPEKETPEKEPEEVKDKSVKDAPIASVDDPLKYKQIADAEISTLADNLLSPESKGADGSGDQETYKLAYGFFQDKKYEKVIEIVPANPSFDFIYLLALSHFKSNDYQAAARNFAVLKEDFRLGYDAGWGELLSLTAQLPKTCASLKTNLEAIEKNTSHFYLEQAARLKDSIDLPTACP